MIEHAPFDVVAFAADGRPTTRADAVVARRPDGWGLAREAMSPGYTLRIVAPPGGPEPWLRGPDAIVELRTSGDGIWYPVDRGGEWAREGFTDPWTALAGVRAHPLLRDGALSKSRRGGGRLAAIRRMGDDDAFVALRFGRRVVVWPVNQCEACGGDGMASDAICPTCGGGGRVTRGGHRRFWIDGRGAPAELLDAEQAAAAIDVIIGTTNTATEADRAAWGLDMENRGEADGRAPTVRQREVLSRVAGEFTLAELQESACHRYLGFTRRMASEMVARGAIESLGDGRYRKTALAVPSCAREPARPPKSGKKARKAPVPARTASAKATPKATPKGKSGTKKTRKTSATAPTTPTKAPKTPRKQPATPPKASTTGSPRPQIGDRVISDDFTVAVVLEVHPDGRVQASILNGRNWGPVAIEDIGTYWFRPRLTNRRRTALEPINEAARGVAHDSLIWLAAHWLDVWRWGGLLDAELRAVLGSIAHDGHPLLSEVAEGLGWSRDEVKRVVARVAGLEASHGMPNPLRIVSLLGERAWDWLPGGPRWHETMARWADIDDEIDDDEDSRPLPAPTSRVGDRFVMPGSLNRLDVVAVGADGRVRVRDRHGDVHGPWSQATQDSRIWFRPHVERAWPGPRAVLEPLNDAARAIGADEPARLAAHWFEAAVFLPALSEDQRRLLIAVAEQGEVTVGWLVDRLEWTRQQLRAVAESVFAMASSHDMPVPMASATVQGERIFTWLGDDAARPAAAPKTEVPLFDALIRDVPKDKRGIYGVAADGRVLPIGVANHNSRLSGAKKALPLVLDAIDAGGPWTIVAVRPGKGRPQHIERSVAERLVAEAPGAGKRIERVLLYTRRPYLLAEAGPEPVMAPAKRVDFKAFTAHQDHSDGSKVYAGPSGSTVLLRAGKAWWVLRLAAGRVWVIVAGPHTFAAARAAALDAAGRPAPAAAVPAALATVPTEAEVDDTARGAGSRAAKLLRKLMTVAQRGDRVVLDPLAGAPMVARLTEVEAQSPRFWERNPVWTVENNGLAMGARAVGKVVAQIAAGQRTEPTAEASDGFDLGWLKHRLRAYGCTKLWAMTNSLRVLICGADDTHTATVNREADGWYWKQTYQQGQVGGGPFQRASALVDDLVARLGLTLQAPSDAAAPAEPTFVLLGCVKGKAAQAAPARDLYRGALWDLRRQYAEARGLPWGIVSGGLGVVGASERVEPYDQRIQVLTPAQRKAWLAKAQAGLERLAGRGAVVEVIASRPYVEALAEPAKALGITLLAPLEGKGIGARKKWLAEQVAALSGGQKPSFSAKDVSDAVKGWGRKGKPPTYTAPGGVVRFGRLGPKGQYRVERRESGRWRVHGPDHRSFAKASRAAVEFVREGWADEGGRVPTLPPEPAPVVAQSEQIGLTVDVGEPPADVPDDRRLAWMIQRAAERLGRPTRGVWVVCGTEVHPIGALPDGIDAALPTVFVDMNPAGRVEAVDADHGFLLAIEPVTRALRRYRLRLTEEQRKRLLDALRLARGEGKRLSDATGIRRRLTEGFRRERVTAKHEVWTDKARSMSWAAPKGATNDQVIEAFFAEMARRLAEGLPDEIRRRAEEVLARAFRMARRRGGPRPKMSRPKAPAPSPKPAPKPSPKPAPSVPDGPDALRGYDSGGQVEWESSVADFCASNAEDPDLCARVQRLGLGQHLDVGGGAAPDLRIRRRPAKGWPKTPKASSKASPKPSPSVSPGYDVIAGHHTRYGYPIWTVRLADRLPKADFDALRARAKRAADPKSTVRTGYYSSYRKNGAIPGFVFGSEAEAQRFVQAAFGASGEGRAVEGGPMPTLAPKLAPAGPFAEAARVSASSAAVLDVLTDGMRGPDAQGRVRHRQFGAPPFAVDRLAEHRFAVFQYGANPDVADATVEFVRLGAADWVPIARWNPNRDLVTRDGRVIDLEGQRSMARFVDDIWMPAIRELLDGGALPARRFERYVGGGRRELGISDAERVDRLVAELRGNASGIDVFGYRPDDGFIADVSFDGIGDKATADSLLAKLARHGAGPWWLVALRGDGAPTARERENARSMLGAAGVERVILVAGAETHELPAAVGGRADQQGHMPTLASQPSGANASSAVDWPEVPFMPGPRTVANLRAVRIAHEAKRSAATPTPEQRRHLLQYSGWGGLSIEKVRRDWPDGIPLPNNRALVHEYYTPWRVCADIAAAVRRLVEPPPGDRTVRPFVRALEPSAGIGRFVHAARFPGWHWTAIELSPLSALILEQTVERPAVIHEGSFESWVHANPDRRFDVIISNPPYGPRGEQMVEDKDRRFRVKAAYQYFILRGLSLLAPGGVAAFLVPGGFLTGRSNAKLREKVDRDADLLAAFRLPSGIFPGARLSLDVVFFRARRAAKPAPDSVFVEGAYFDKCPAHVLGEVKPSGRWGEPEIIGDYRGLPAFEPRGQGRADEGGPMPTLPATDSFADPIRLTEPFVSLHALQTASTRAYNYGKAFRPGDVPKVSKAGWRTAVEDVVRSKRGKGQRLKDLRAALEDLRAAANKASGYEQGGKFTADGLTRDDARQLVLRLRDGRDAIKAGIAVIKDQSRRKAPRVDVKAPRFRAWLTLLGAEHLAGLPTLSAWDTLAVADVAGLAELEQARFIRVVAVDGHAVHIRLTDHGKTTLAAHPSSRPKATAQPAPRCPRPIPRPSHPGSASSPTAPASRSSCSPAIRWPGRARTTSTA